MPTLPLTMVRALALLTLTALASSDAFQQHIGLSAPPPRMAAVHSSTADLDVMMTGSEGSDGAATTATTAAPARKGLGGTIINEGGCAMAPDHRSFGHIIMTR